jgi:hypothetical protein
VWPGSTLRDNGQRSLSCAPPLQTAYLGFMN